MIPTVPFFPLRSSKHDPIAIMPDRLNCLPGYIADDINSHRGGPGSNPGLVMWDFVLDKSDAGAGFSENFGFPCQSTFHLLLHNHLHCHPRLAQ
jgi:hypothetical protein